VNLGPSALWQFLHFGRSGVDIFFVLSGFLISLLHWRDIGNPSRVGRYAKRRLTRIYPTYWLLLLLIVPFDVFTHTLFDGYANAWEVVKSVFLLPQDHTILDVTWSLRNELLFYLLFGLMIYNARLGIGVAAAWIAATMMRPLFVPVGADPWINVLTYPMNVEFLAGVAAGWAFPRLNIARPLVILGVGLVGLAALWVFEDHMWSLHPDAHPAPATLPWPQFMLICCGYGGAVVAVILGLTSLEKIDRLTVPPALVTVGGASYLLYLIHVPALLILGAGERVLHLTRFVPVWSIGLADMLAVVVAAVILHVFVEKPLLRAVR
jgi:peptidoglycan/LPS O-acetylase OafA/YrhL